MKDIDKYCDNEKKNQYLLICFQWCFSIVYRCNTEHPEYADLAIAPYNDSTELNTCNLPIYANIESETTVVKDIECRHFTFSKEYFDSTIVTEVSISMCLKRLS